MKWIVRLAVMFGIAQLMAFSCYTKDSRDNPTLLRLTNLSSKNIMACTYSVNGYINTPSIGKKDYESLRANPKQNTILPGETKVIFDAGYAGGLHVYPKLIVYILDADVVLKYSWEELGSIKFKLEKQYFSSYNLETQGPYVIYKD